MRAAKAHSKKSEVDLDELFSEFKTTGNPEVMEEIVRRYLNLVPFITRKFATGRESLEDLIQVGYIGLINAVNDFDPERGVKFSTYATHKISGEIRHYLRDKSSLMREPRWAQSLNWQINQAIEVLSQRLHRLPTVSEIAGEVGITEEKLLAVLKTRYFRQPMELPPIFDSKDSEFLIDQIRSRLHIDRDFPIEDKIVLFDALMQLSELKRKIIYLFFFEDLTQSQIAKRIGISQRHVSRLLQSSLSKLKSVVESR